MIIPLSVICGTVLKDQTWPVIHFPFGVAAETIIH